MVIEATPPWEWPRRPLAVIQAVPPANGGAHFQPCLSDAPYVPLPPPHPPHPRPSPEIAKGGKNELTGEARSLSPESVPSITSSG